MIMLQVFNTSDEILDGNAAKIDKYL